MFSWLKYSKSSLQMHHLIGESKWAHYSGATYSNRRRTDVSSRWGIQMSAPQPRGRPHSALWGCWWETARCRLSASRRRTGRSFGNARRSKDGRPTPTRRPGADTRFPPARRRKTPRRRRRSLRDTPEKVSPLRTHHVALRQPRVQNHWPSTCPLTFMLCWFWCPLWTKVVVLVLLPPVD